MLELQSIHVMSFFFKYGAFLPQENSYIEKLLGGEFQHRVPWITKGVKKKFPVKV